MKPGDGPTIQPRDKLHPCIVETCSDLVPHGFFMCQAHWAKVTPATRASVWGCWKAYRAAIDADSAEREESARLAYAAARATALTEAQAETLNLFSSAPPLDAAPPSRPSPDLPPWERQ